ncbi:unnamed protein product [Didymodactylos carnosus]|uniref:Uncharacterized protein n=1 Tax=Didymodactylos carnosus TaxID=1234261 RepID=A0A815L9N6_9BILA|nr:unnamed protein product [Didymodactylos carnosus]CAF1435564.1 unnamed protein product [Didymodactylos carnosus]CAF4232917.1 unnamed protein product [Didymodactylos carnosus]CAF4297433.1 unnamed protein product [Didymodactylos carnosus]
MSFPEKVTCINANCGKTFRVSSDKIRNVSDQQTYSWLHEILTKKGSKIPNKEQIFCCQACILGFRRSLQNTSSSIADFHEQRVEMDTSDCDNSDGDDEQLLTVDSLTYAGSSHRQCVICRKDVGAGCCVMLKRARLDLLIIHHMYAPHGVRCCRTHLITERLLPDSFVNMENIQTMNVALDSNEVINLLNDLLGLLEDVGS